MSTLLATQTAALPLSDEQRSGLRSLTEGASPEALLWISGYTAGLAAARGASAVIEAPAASKAQLTVLYGSQTGNARTQATRLVERAQAQGLAARLVNLANYTLAELARERAVAVVISTQGDGDPPDEARLFFKQLLSARAPKLPELRYSVLGLGDSSYAKFCEVGKRIDARLAELGARRLSERADADLDIETVARPWTEATLAAGSELLAKRASVTALRPAAVASSPARVPATLLLNQRLCSRDSAVDVRHLELAVAAGALPYQPGDALAIHLATPAALIDEFLAHTSLPADIEVAHGGQTRALRDWLAQRELTRLSRPLLQRLAQAAPAHPLLARGEALYAEHQVNDLLAAAPIALDAAEWVAALAPLKARAYSIASSADAVGDEVHLTVAVQRSAPAGRTRSGLASGQLALLAEGAALEVSLEANPRFRLPADDSRDLIMIGPGTGVAPFRAFLQQRIAQGARGRHWLYFGHRHLRHEFLYQTEWLQALKQGQLQRLDVAFSRDQAERRYVQHLIGERARALVEWIDGGAHLYVCGDASRMAPDVERALIEAIATVRAIDRERASEELDTLAASGRYARDVY
ncbi:MAG: flavodoxin domain-containing protein [Lysobacterales bacterium]